MASDNYEEKYTKPDLRRRIKEEIKQSDKGGKPGQWSARKSQLLVQEYEKQGGGYLKDKKDEAAKSLEEWTEQNWQTMEGEGRAREEGITRRYLPEAVWNRLSDNEKREAERTKEKGSKEGEQYVHWTPAIARAMQAEGYSPDGSDTSESDDEPTQQELYEQAQELEISGRSKMDKAELQEAIAQANFQDSANGKSSKQSDGDGLQNQSKDELYEKAKDMEISGRSKMNKEELAEAIQQEQNT